MWHLLPLEENITLSITTASQYWFSSHEPAKTRIETASYELRLRPRISAELNRVDEVLEYTRSTRPAQRRLTSLEKGAVLNRNRPLGLTHSVSPTIRPVNASATGWQRRARRRRRRSSRVRRLAPSDPARNGA